MAGFTERVSNAWSVLWGLRKATVGHPPGEPQRIGTPTSGEDIAQLSQAYEFYRHYTHLEPDRQSIYNDMDEMMLYVLASSALEAYIEDALQEDPNTGRILDVRSPNPKVQQEIEKLFERIELEDRLVGDLWNLGKYGDYFCLLMYAKGDGVHDARPMEPRICHRHEGLDRVLRGFTIGDQAEADVVSDSEDPKYKPWDLIHWRLRRFRPLDPYGTPFFINIRMTYKTMKLMEEQMAIYRMNMHADRLVFKVFTGSMNPEERYKVVRKWRKAFEKIVSINKGTGTMISEYAPWAIDNSIYWPQGQNEEKSGVEKFPGSANCFTGDTKISLLNGTEAPIKDVKPGDWVYSCDPKTGRIRPGLVSASFCSGKDADLVKVTLDNGETIRCTPNHKFIARDGSSIKACDLIPGTSLMPLYRAVSTKEEDGIEGYETVWDNELCERRFTHRMVTSELNIPVRQGHVRHHIDFNKRNNRPDNLMVVSWAEHGSYHVDLNDRKWNGPDAEVNRQKARETLAKTKEKLWSDPNYLIYWQSLIKAGKVGWDTAWANTEFATMMSEYAKAGRVGWGHHWKDPEFAERTSKAVAKSNSERFKRDPNTARCNLASGSLKKSQKYKEATPEEQVVMLQEVREKILQNHKVVSVVPCGKEDVYNITVGGHHNFALTAGVVVRNSGDLYDIEYMRDLFFAGTRIPKAYMGFEDSQGYRAADTLSQQSIKFARGVKRLRRPLLQGYARLVKTHLALKGIDATAKENSFDLTMAPNNYLEEAQRSEFYAKRFETVNYMLDMGAKMAQALGGNINQAVWAQYVLSEFAGFDDSTILKLLTPATGSGITFAPVAKSITYEALTVEQRNEVRKAIEGNDKLREAIERLVALDALMPERSSVSSMANGRIEVPSDATFDRGLFEKATHESLASEKRVTNERREKMKSELRDIAERAQQEFPEG